MLLYVLECCLMIVLLLIGVTQVVIPILQGKPLFPMLHMSFDERLKTIEAELERTRRIEALFESSLEIQPSEKEKGKN